jgi:2-keto-4-pentenoate hydratase/2-oxohepta-3-ene-1,7-dioic acid hydratase in catechol pathway
MRIARFVSSGATSYGIVEGDNVTPIEGDLFGTKRPSGAAVPLSGVKLLAPLVPRVMLAVALNYPSHLGGDPPSPRPELFVKANSCLANPGDPIMMPTGCNSVQYEGEMVVVIGKRCRRVSVDDALQYVFGVTCGNDVSARDWQRGDSQWFRGKSCDTFGPIGPWVVDDVDVTNTWLSTRLNGEEVQRCNTNEMVNSVAETISFISRVVTLEQGDVIFTGTSGRPRDIKAGDVVEVDVEGVGVLRNPVVADDMPMLWKDLREAPAVAARS